MTREKSTEVRMTLYRLTGLDSLPESVREKYLELETFQQKWVLVENRKAFLVYGKTPDKEVSWGPVIAGLTGQSIALTNSVAAAVLVIPRSERITPSNSVLRGGEQNIENNDEGDEGIVAWALSYGMGFQLLDQNAIDNGFGQRVAIRSANPLGLHSISKTTLDERPRIERSTIASGAHLRNFGFEDLGDLATRLVTEGRVEGIGSGDKLIKLRGADALSLPLSKDPKELIDDLLHIEKTLLQKPASDELAALEQLALIKDKSKIAELDKRLIETIGEEDSPLLTLSFPHELIDEYGKAEAFKLLGTRERGRRDYLPTLEDLLKPIKSVPEEQRLDKMGRISVLLFENLDDEAPSSPKIPLKKWLAFQTEVGDNRYFLHHGRWYLMDRNYADVVKRRVREIFDRGPLLQDLPVWELTDQGSEEEKKRKNSELAYNKKLATHLGGLCLDQVLVHSETHKRGIEACDVLLEDGTFIHVKNVGSSSPASHLLAQALVSTEVLTYDSTAQEHLAERIRSKGSNPDAFILKPKQVVIIMAKEGKKLDADSLFTFTQVNLSRQVAQLNNQGVDVYIAPILRTIL